VTDYVVLGIYEGLWQEAGMFSARSPQGAIRACKDADSLPDRIKNTDIFVAIPRRSFRPVTVKVETKTALRFS
jgi:hypothetical protein